MRSSFPSGPPPVAPSQLRPSLLRGPLPTKPAAVSAHNIGVMDSQQPLILAWVHRRFPALVIAFAALIASATPQALARQAGVPPQEAMEAAAEALVEFRPTVQEVADSKNLSEAPTTVAELLDLESRIRAVVEKVLPATVGLTIGQAQGSGVLISPDGYVLTAAHVAGRPGRGRRHPGERQRRRLPLRAGDRR